VTHRGYSRERGELTPRMRAVLVSASLGHTERETALELHIAVGTVKSVRAAAIARLGARNTSGAVGELGRRGEL
jgi:DNA-binding NarL/FixJ family response regulator